MRSILFVTLLTLLVAAIAGCTDTPMTSGAAAMDTSHGCIQIEFFEEEAPETVANFLAYAEDGFYDDTIFHRIIQGFMIQGGGFTEAGEQKETRDPIPLEYEVPNEQSNVAMARSSDPDSATSQFFINTADNSDNLGPGPDSHGYAVFARVTEGMDVVDAIAAEPTGSGPMGQSDWPSDPPVIEGVRPGGECGAGETGEEEEPVAGVEAGLITTTKVEQGFWETNISAGTDHVPLWLRNTGNRADTFTLSVESPDAWNVSMETASVELTPEGRSGDAFATYLTIDLDSSEAKEDPIVVDIVSENDPDTSTTLTIRPVVADSFGEPVSTVGDMITVSYAGSFDSGEEFDSGSFSTEAGSAQTVPGFANGLLGLAQGETVQIRFPPEAGYGYNPGPGREQFAGEWLNFEITLDSIG